MTRPPDTPDPLLHTTGRHRAGAAKAQTTDAMTIDAAATSAAATNSATLDLASSAVALAVPQAQAEYATATNGGTLNGAGLSIGILSDSFNLDGGMAADIAAGYLPAASDIDIVSEGDSGDDEGRAMAELVHAIAPGAKIYFYSAINGESDFADGISTLVADGCSVIVDDVTYFDEPFFQDTGTITEAVENAISSGVDYFTAADNSSDNFYESIFTPMTYTLPTIGSVTVHDVDNGSPFEAVTLDAHPKLDFTLEWTQPYGANTYDIGVGLFSLNTITDVYKLVRNFTTITTGGNPVLQADTTLSNVAAGTYYLAFYDSSGSIPANSTFKLLFFQDSTATVIGSGAGIGSGASIGHELVPGANTVAAVNVADTPAEGTATPKVESYSAAGTGETYIDADGHTLAQPIDDGKPDFAATDGTQTSVFNPFDGTSAAAPNAAAIGLLMLQADSRLTTTQVTYLLERSAIPTGDTTTGGAGLIQADTAVAGALTAASTPIWTAQDGSTLWSDRLDWSDGQTPGDGSAVRLSDGLGIFTGAYAVTFDQRADSVGALTVDGGSVTRALPTLAVQTGDVLTVGSLTLGDGIVEVAGTLADSGALLQGGAGGSLLVEQSGRVSFGGGTAGNAIIYDGVGGQLVFAATDAATLTTGLATEIGGFAQGDVLDLSGLAESTVAAVHVDGTSVTVVDAAGTTLAALSVRGSFTSLGFGADRDGGTVLLACFVGGTRLATDSGEVAVELLRPGQRLRCADGTLMPLRWLGRSRIAWRGQGAAHVLPVRIRAGALGNELPRRDLLVSPGHALLLDGLLVQAGALVNGIGIVREPAMPAIFGYWHVELDTHALVLAEGVATESFLDGAEPIGFDNWHERSAPPDAHAMPLARCKSARQLPADLRARLSAWRPADAARVAALAA